MARDSGPGSKTPDVVMTKWRLDDCRRSLLGWHGAPDLQIEAAVQAPQKIGQRLAHVAKDYFHAREALEQAHVPIRTGRIVQKIAASVAERKAGRLCKSCGVEEQRTLNSQNLATAGVE